MTMPSVVVMPTRRPISLRMWAIMRTVVVLPLVPVTRDDRDARVRAAREEQVDDRLGHVLRLALGRVGVHPEAGRGVDLDDGAALLAHRHGDVGHDEVDAGDVQADDPRGGLGDLDVLGVRLDASGRSTCRRSTCCRSTRAAPACPSAARRPASSPACATSSSAAVVERDARQHLLVADAAARVGVLDVDQLANGVLAVADDAGRDALRDGGHLAADDQHAVVVAGDVRSRRPRRRRGSRRRRSGSALRTSSRCAGRGSRRGRGCRRAA